MVQLPLMRLSIYANAVSISAEHDTWQNGRPFSTFRRMTRFTPGFLRCGIRPHFYALRVLGNCASNARALLESATLVYDRQRLISAP